MFGSTCILFYSPALLHENALQPTTENYFQQILFKTFLVDITYSCCFFLFETVDKVQKSLKVLLLLLELYKTKGDPLCMGSPFLTNNCS